MCTSTATARHIIARANRRGAGAPGGRWARKARPGAASPVTLARASCACAEQGTCTQPHSLALQMAGQSKLRRTGNAHPREHALRTAAACAPASRRHGRRPARPVAMAPDTAFGRALCMHPCMAAGGEAVRSRRRASRARGPGRVAPPAWLWQHPDPWLVARPIKAGRHRGRHEAGAGAASRAVAEGPAARPANHSRKGAAHGLGGEEGRPPLQGAAGAHGLEVPGERGPRWHRREPREGGGSLPRERRRRRRRGGAGRTTAAERAAAGGACRRWRGAGQAWGVVDCGAARGRGHESGSGCGGKRSPPPLLAPCSARGRGS
jgi:hypothetical protein